VSQDDGFLIQALRSIVNDITAGGPGLGDKERVVLSWPGLPIDPQLYGHPFDPETKKGSLKAVQLFSSLVNLAPAVGPIYQTTQIRIEDIYAFMLDASIKPSQPLVAKQFSSARDLFESSRREGADGLPGSYCPSQAVPASWSDEGSEGLWQSVSSAPTDHAGAPPIEAVGWNSEVFKQLPSWRFVAKQKAPGGGLVDPPNPLGTELQKQIQGLARINIAPEANADLSKVVSNAAAAEVKFNAAKAAVIGTKPFFEKNASFGGANLAFLAAPEKVEKPHADAWFAADVKTWPSPEAMALQTSLRFSYKFQRVNIERTWLNALLFALPGWHLEGLPAGWISNGKFDVSNSGVCPAIPSAFVAIKELAIEGKWDELDRTRAERAAKGDEAAALGPFLLSAGGHTPSFEDDVLKVPGIQIAAWLVSVVPMTPPE
jgi:hypothetical protein